MYKEDLALNNLEGLIWHEIQRNSVLLFCIKCKNNFIQFSIMNCRGRLLSLMNQIPGCVIDMKRSITRILAVIARNGLTRGLGDF